MVTATALREAALEFVAEVESLFGDRLASIVLYGSIPREEAVLGLSDVNLLVLLDSVSTHDLLRLSPAAGRWMSSGKASPLMFGTEEFRRSVDAFAIEISDLKDRREVLFGSDPVANLEVPLSAMRHQIEHELRARRVQLHQAMLLAAKNPEQVGDLLLRSLPAFVCYLRAILRLAGRDVPDDSEDVIRAAANVIDTGPEPFLTVWGWRRAGAAPDLLLSDPVVQGYDKLIDLAIAWVDANHELASASLTAGGSE